MRRLLTILVTVTTIMTLTAGAASAGRGDKGRPEKTQPEKVAVCHHDSDTAEYHLININRNAIGKHIAHGDASPGEALAGADGAALDELCEVVNPTTKIAEGSFSGNNLVNSFTAYTGPGDVITGTMAYSFGVHVITGTITDACLDATAGSAVVWGPGFSTRDGDGYLVLTLVLQPDGTLKTLAKFESSEYSGAIRFGKQCSTGLALASGTGSLTFWQVGAS